LFQNRQPVCAWGNGKNRLTEPRDENADMNDHGWVPIGPLSSSLVDEISVLAWKSLRSAGETETHCIKSLGRARRKSRVYERIGKIQV
jgi:hypothetical protein